MGNYIGHFLRALRPNQFCEENEVVLVHGGEASHAAYSEFRHVRVPLLDRPWPLDVFRSNWILPRFSEYRGVDLIHSTTQWFPVRATRRYASVITVFDIIAVHGLDPTLQSRRFKRWYVFEVLLKRACRAADRVITISEHTRRDVIQWADVPEERVIAIHGACSPRFRVILREEFGPAIERELVARLPARFVLYVGTYQPRKNVPVLVRAFERVKSGARLPHKLVLVGRQEMQFQAARTLVRERGLQDEIIFLDFVPDEHLPYLYNLADLFVFPSSFEGLGLPVLEAMSCGAPVVTTTAASLPEVSGAAAILVEPHDVEGLARAMAQVLTDPQVRDRLSRLGLEQARRFSWEENAAKTVQVYQAVLEERRLCGASAWRNGGA